MLLKYVNLGLSLVALASAAVIQERAACNADYCLRALRASQFPTRLPQASADCSSYLSLVYTSTVTVTASDRATTSVAVATTTVYGDTNVAAGKRDLAERANPTLPAYASPCSGGVRFTSACSCIGVTPIASTSTATVTTTISYTATSTISYSATTPVFVPPPGDGRDEGSYLVVLPFELDLYRMRSNNVWLSINGILSFTQAKDFAAYDNRPLPVNEPAEGPGLPPVAACIYWDDLQLFGDQSHGIWYGIQGSPGSRVATFEWFASPYAQPNSPFRFFMTYEEANPGKLTYHYEQMTFSGDNALVGIQSYPDDYVQYSNDQTGKVPSGTKLRVDTIANTITPFT